MVPENLEQSDPPGTPPPKRSRRVAVAFSAMLVAAVAWAFVWGAHEHLPPGVSADLGGYTADRVITVDSTTVSFDLSAIEVTPGEVLDIHLVGSAGAPHAFVLTGASAGAQLDTRIDDAGDTIVRLRVPEDGQLTFWCTVPGHEGMHGTLVVNPA